MPPPSPARPRPSAWRQRSVVVEAGEGGGGGEETVVVRLACQVVRMVVVEAVVVVEADEGVFALPVLKQATRRPHS